MIGDVSVSYKISRTHQHRNFHAKLTDSSGLIKLSEYIRHVYKSRIFSALAEPYNKHGRASFSEYLDTIECSSTLDNRYIVGGDEAVFFRNAKVNARLDPLRDDFCVPNLFDHGSLKSIGFWLSAQGLRSRLHYDSNGARNLNARIVGSKEVTLFAPNDCENHYPFIYSKFEPGNCS